MVLPVRGHPARGCVFHAAQGHKHKKSLEPQGATKTTMRQQPMVAEVDADSAVEINSRPQQSRPGPTEEPRHEHEQGRRVPDKQRHGIAPQNPPRYLRGIRQAPASARIRGTGHRLRASNRLGARSRRRSEFDGQRHTSFREGCLASAPQAPKRKRSHPSPSRNHTSRCRRGE